MITWLVEWRTDDTVFTCWYNTLEEALTELTKWAYLYDDKLWDNFVITPVLNAAFSEWRGIHVLWSGWTNGDDGGPNGRAARCQRSHDAMIAEMVQARIDY